MEQKMEIFKSLLPQMLSITNLIDNKPKIRFFEGEEEIKEIYKDTLNYPAGKILIWISEAVFKKIDRLFFDNFYTPRRIKNKIAVRAIVSDNSVAKKFQSEGGKFLRQTKIDKINDIQIESEIMLYGNKNIAIISVDEIMGFVIESPKMFRTLRAIFEIHWASIQDNNLL
ncbi:MAG: hypothetical protein GWO79_01005 [Actinobacteria bacterium]|nr:hypothetical protein [Actinomycetota bacterium]